MIWLEMSRDEVHGGDGWEFGRCVWSPTHKKNGSRWAFWSLILDSKVDDIVIHLQGKNNAAFVGYSTVSSNGIESANQPPEPGDWGYSSFYRADLEQFTPFPSPIPLENIFQSKDDELTNYFLNNKKRLGNQKERLFYVLQGGRLQCLNGAYFFRSKLNSSRYNF